jgi:hypothetical protein
MITTNHCKELLCRSYLTAVASRAGHNIDFHRELDYGVDGSFKHVEQRGRRRHESVIALDFQAKASVDWYIDKNNVVYDLEKKNYNDLVSRASVERAVPFYLILLCLPRDDSLWANFSADGLVIKKCAYFARPAGIAATDENGTKRVRIAISDALTPQNLVRLLDGIKDGTIQP